MPAFGVHEPDREGEQDLRAHDRRCEVPETAKGGVRARRVCERASTRATRSFRRRHGRVHQVPRLRGRMPCERDHHAAAAAANVPSTAEPVAVPTNAEKIDAENARPCSVKPLLRDPARSCSGWSHSESGPKSDPRGKKAAWQGLWGDEPPFCPGATSPAPSLRKEGCRFRPSSDNNHDVGGRKPMAYETTSESTEALLVTGGLWHRQNATSRRGALPRCWPKNAAAGNVLVLCATPPGPHACASERLTARVGAKRAASNCRHRTRLSARRAGRRRRAPLVGARATLLTAFEEIVPLMEDMKVSGLRPKRLREMPASFYRSWTELADDDPDWLLPGEEADVHTLLKENLVFMRAVIEPEAANLAARYLRETTKRGRRILRARADGRLRLRKPCLADAGESRRNLLDHRGGRRGNLHRDIRFVPLCRRNRRISRNASRCCLRAPGCRRARCRRTGRSGKRHARSRVRTGGAHGGQPSPQERPHGRSSCRTEQLWSRNIATALHARGVPTEASPSQQPLRGDVRDNARCTPARIATALNLVAQTQTPRLGGAVWIRRLPGEQRGFRQTADLREGAQYRPSWTLWRC